MAFYETVFIARQDYTPAQYDELVKTVEGIISSNGGKVAKTEKWGLKQLAYKIKKNKKGYYAMVQFEGNGDTVREMDRRFGLNEDVVRYMTITIKEISKDPSPMMAKDYS